MPDSGSAPERSYGCTFACGNPYDYIIVSVSDNSVEMLCVPCYIRLAADMVAAITDPDDPEVYAALQAIGADNAQTVPGPSGKPRGHNAPSGTADQDILDAFDAVITPDELGKEFR